MDPILIIVMEKTPVLGGGQIMEICLVKKEEGDQPLMEIMEGLQDLPMEVIQKLNQLWINTKTLGQIKK